MDPFVKTILRLVKHKSKEALTEYIETILRNAYDSGYADGYSEGYYDCEENNND